MAYNRRAMYDLVMQAQQKTTLMTKEVNRVITQANHRLDRITRDGKVVSPAVDSLGGKRFSIRGMTWEQQKTEYMRAIAFMQEPTSTLGGARSFTNEGIAQTFNVSKKGASNEQWGKYMEYYKDLYNEYAPDLMHGTISPDFSWLDSDQIAQYFYDRALEQSTIDIEAETQRLLSRHEQIEREQANKVADQTLEMLKEMGLKF